MNRSCQIELKEGEESVRNAVELVDLAGTKPVRHGVEGTRHRLRHVRKDGR